MSKSPSRSPLDLQMNPVNPGMSFHKLETHPQTGAEPLVEIYETVQEIVVPVYAQAELPYKILDEYAETLSGHVSISTMHLMAYGDEIIPLRERIVAYMTNSANSTCLLFKFRPNLALRVRSSLDYYNLF